MRRAVPESVGFVLVRGETGSEAAIKFIAERRGVIGSAGLALCTAATYERRVMERRGVLMDDAAAMNVDRKVAAESCRNRSAEPTRRKKKRKIAPRPSVFLTLGRGACFFLFVFVKLSIIDHTVTTGTHLTSPGLAALRQL